MADTEIVIRGGLICDGTGAEPYPGDILLRDGRIAEMGEITAPGADVFNASGCIVTPGFVDLHTHYDGQAIWSDRLVPSSEHGVTTAVLGNCGVGFAPCRAEDRERLIGVMEGVEDIPEVVMADGLTWDWESFPEYLDALEKRQRDIDVAVYVPHSALRVFVMGERGAAREPATAADLERMQVLLRDAMKAGALGFATSRQFIHRTHDGAMIPSFDAAENELRLLVEAMGPKGVFQIVLDTPHSTWTEELAVVRRVIGTTGCMTMFTLGQGAVDPDEWRGALALVDTANAEGQTIRAQVFPRPIGILIGHNLSANPFMDRPGYRALPTDLAARVAALRDPAVKAQILAEEATGGGMTPLQAMSTDFARMFVLGDRPNYEPRAEDSIAARAAELGVTPHDLAYDLLLEDDGQAMLYVAVGNYGQGTLDPIREMMLDDNTVLGLGDGGAHYGMICDASFPTFMLSHWVRDRDHGRLPLPWVVNALTRTPAHAVGLHDRGVLAPGLKADINVIDLARVALHKPSVRYDLPAGGRRLTQGADGFVATFVNGVPIQRGGQPTGRLPGQVIRQTATA